MVVFLVSTFILQLQSGTDVRVIRHPLLVKHLRNEISIRDSPYFDIPFSTYNWQQIVFIHNSKYSFGVALNVFTFQSDMYSVVSVDTVVFGMAYAYLFC